MGLLRSGHVAGPILVQGSYTLLVPVSSGGHCIHCVPLGSVPSWAHCRAGCSACPLCLGLFLSLLFKPSPSSSGFHGQICCPELSLLILPAFVS